MKEVKGSAILHISLTYFFRIICFPFLLPFRLLLLLAPLQVIFLVLMKEWPTCPLYVPLLLVGWSYPYLKNSYGVWVFKGIGGRGVIR